MKKIIFFLIILLLLLPAKVLFAQETGLPDSGTLPDSPFYFLKAWKESVLTFFTFGAENKAKQYLRLAEVRLAEYQKMVEKGKTEIAEKTFEKYELQLDRALEKVDEARIKGKNVGNIAEEIKEKRIKHAEALANISENMPDEAKQKIFGDRSQKWLDFFSVVKEKYPQVISEPPDGNANLPLKLVLNCPIPALPQDTACQGEWMFKLSGNCPYFACSNDEQKQAKEPQMRPDELPAQPEESNACIEVITPAMSQDGTCKEFPTPCDVPMGWNKVDKCPSVAVLPEPSKPTSLPEPTPTEIRYYTCPDGTKVESGKCYGTGETFTCSIISSPELKCSSPTPPVPKGGTCVTSGETKYYQCPNNTQTPWCVCGPESGLAGAKNIWRCQHLPELYCPKPTPTLVPPVAEETVCCIDGKCVQEAKDECLLKSGKVINSCAECINSAPTPTPIPACTVSGIKDYKCPDGTSIKWQCSCGEDSWSCQANPAIFCPGLRDTTSLIISDIWIRDMFWTEETPVPNATQGPGIFHFFWGTSKPATSYVEYGLTDSYGLTTPTPPSSLGIQHTNNAQTELKGNTLYHSRIVATDARGNTAASGDFTFFPAFNFTTIPGTVQPYIRLLGPGISPTHWKIGQTPSIVWEALGVNKVNIDLVMFDSSGNRLKTYSVAKDVSSSGTAGGSYIYTWKVPSNSEFLQAGYKFKVVISDPVTFVFGTNANDLFIEE